MRAGIGGRAIIECKVETDGTLSSCLLASEQPSNEGFGAAALKLSTFFRMKPQTLDGTPVKSSAVRIPVVFRVESAFAAPRPDNDAGGPVARRQTKVCVNTRGDEEINACTWVIQSGLWSAARLGFAYEHRGEGYLSRGLPDKAIADLTQVLSQEPKNAIAYNSRGNAYQDRAIRTRSSEDLLQAIADYTQAITLNPNPIYPYYGRAHAYRDTGQYALAIEDYSKTIKLDPKFDGAFDKRGNLYIRMGVYDQAISDYSEAISLNPNIAAYYNSRGWARHLKEEDAQALPDAEKAVSMSPDNALFLATRAVIYEKLGRRDDAIADYTAALKANPRLTFAADGLKRLKAAS